MSIDGDSLAPPSPNDIQDEGEQDAEQDRGREREVEGCVLAAVEDVAGETSQGQVEAGEEGQQKSGDDEDRAEDDEEFA